MGWLHDDVIKWKHFPRYWPFVRGIHRPPVNSPHKGQWRGALMFSLICVSINDWVNNRDAGDLRRYRAHYDDTVMSWIFASNIPINIVFGPIYLLCLAHISGRVFIVIYLHSVLMGRMQFFHQIWICGLFTTEWFKGDCTICIHYHQAICWLREIVIAISLIISCKTHKSICIPSQPGLQWPFFLKPYPVHLPAQILFITRHCNNQHARVPVMKRFKWIRYPVLMADSHLDQTYNAARMF